MPKKAMSDESLKFDVHPSVVYRLGDELITDINQALLELIKNSYDADASYVKVTVNSKSSNNASDSKYPKASGSISIEDNGIGMDIKTIVDGWLLVSNSGKRDFKKQGKVTKKGRTPLGDKGLGRLGAQRLGYNSEIFTKTADSDEQLNVSFSWKDFLSVKRLTDVPVYFNTLESSKKSGTTVLISDLRNVSAWQGEESIKQLEQDLSKLLSPYKKNKSFRLIVIIDGKKLDLAEFSGKIREISHVRYDLSFDENIFEIKGCAKLDFFRPEQKTSHSNFAALVEHDEGEEFFKFLLTQPKAKRFNLEKSQGNKWYVDFTYSKKFINIDKLVLIDGIPANPGPFNGEIDSFNLGRTAFNISAVSIFDRISEFRTHIKTLSGISIYRDGFNIKVDSDWVGFGKESSEGQSYYGLKENTTLGYIEISARNNNQLEETTDREGFKQTPYYVNFYKIITEFKDFSSNAHEFLRRGYNDYVKKHREELIGLDGPVEVERLPEIIISKAAEAEKYKSKLVKVNTTDPHNSKILSGGKDSNDEILSIIDYLDKIQDLGPVGQVLSDRIDSLKQQIIDMHGTIGLGLTAEALSHEIFNISDNLAHKTSAIKSYLNKKSINDISIRTYSEFVGSSTSALRKQIAHLSPSLKYVREKKESILLSNYFLHSVSDFYESRLAKKHIRINVVCEENRDFTVYMNKGKLTQIVDNLILNSEYWLAEDIRNNRSKEGIITITVRRPFVTVEDNGRGIECSLEAAIFEPFITNKGREKGQSRGRGLGLFIIKQLLDSEGCYISLLPQRNEYKRLYSFQIDFRGAIDDR